MAEAGRCYFACANSIKAGQTQLINQPSLSVRHFCYSERRQVRNLACAYLSLRHISPPAIPRTQRENRVSFGVTQEEPLQLVPCHSHNSRIDQPIFRGTQLVQKTGTEGMLWQQNFLGGISPLQRGFHQHLNDNWQVRIILRHVLTQIFTLTTNTFITHLSHVQYSSPVVDKGLIHLLKGTFLSQ